MYKVLLNFVLFMFVCGCGGGNSGGKKDTVFNDTVLLDEGEGEEVLISDSLFCNKEDGCESSEKNGCSFVGFSPKTENTFIDETNAPNYNIAYFAADSEEEKHNEILIEIRQGVPFNGPSAPGTYELSGKNSATCGVCVFLYGDCDSKGCKKVFFPQKGKLEIDMIGGAGINFDATLNAILKEVEIDPQTNKSTFVENGDVWCLENYHISQIIAKKTKPGVNECEKDGTGKMLGDKIADFTLTNCKGEEFNLHSLCGKAKAVWIVGVAGWCSSCDEFLPQAAQKYKMYKPSLLELMVILSEDANGATPTLNYCEKYAQEHGIDPSVMFIDSKFQILFSHIESYMGENLSVPWQAALDGDDMRYKASSGQNNGNLPFSEILKLLND